MPQFLIIYFFLKKEEYSKEIFELILPFLSVVAKKYATHYGYAVCWDVRLCNAAKFYILQHHIMYGVTFHFIVAEGGVWAEKSQI